MLNKLKAQEVKNLKPRVTIQTPLHTAAKGGIKNDSKPVFLFCRCERLNDNLCQATKRSFKGIKGTNATLLGRADER